jgi:uncharacterized protein YcbK (DUF882 family)
VLAAFGRKLNDRASVRAGWGIGLASVLMLAGVGSVKDATATGDTRTLTLHHTHSGEDLTVTFKRNGRYDEAGLKQLNHHLRDWRSQDQTSMDRRLFDILWEVYRDVDARQPIHIISAYRSPKTNAMLRRRSSGVARHSQHMSGHAMDFFIPGVALEKIRIAGLRLQRGGVGFYPTSGSPFVHLDTGNVRHWPRMSHDQLAKVFPNGRTVHMAADGSRLPGYELALAEIQKRGDGDAASGAGNKPSLFTSLFKGKTDDEDEEGAPVQAVPTRPNPSSVMVASADKAAAPANVPVPRAKPSALDSMIKPAAAAPVQLASAVEVVLPARASAEIAPPRPPMPLARPDLARADDGKPKLAFQTPADIINARGFWDDMPEPKQATPAQVAAITARQALAAADTTSSIDVSGSQALAYAAATVERTPVVAASAPIPRSVRPASAGRNPMAVNAVTTVIGKARKAPGVAMAARLTAAGRRDSDIWMRAMILTPSLTNTMSASVIGEPDLTQVRPYFAKPASVVAMSFGDDPMAGMTTEGFTGAAVASLATHSFVTRLASLR